MPLIEIRPAEDQRPLDAALENLAAYEWVVFTSVNGVAAAGDRLRTMGAETRVAAVGPVTADAVRALGVEPSFVAARASEDIARGLGELEGTRVLLPQADIADPRLAERAPRAGATVDAVVAYRTVQVEPAMWDPPAADRGRNRPRERLGRSGPRGNRQVLRWASGTSTVLVCIGPKTAAVAREVGLPVGVVADESTGDGIIRALVSHFAEAS